jgi:uncharacterized protein (DUF1330 family)
MTHAPAYIVARIQVTDWGRYGEYVKHTPRVIAQFGGRFVVRGAAATVLEGPDDGLRTVIIEFPSLEKAKAFYASAEYQAVKGLRDGAGSGTFVAIEGYDPSAWAQSLAASQALDPPAPSTARTPLPEGEGGTHGGAMGG